MNSFVLWFIIWHFRTSFQQMMIMKPIETSKSNILLTIKIQTIAAYWVECQQTANCETIGTNSEDKNKNGYVVDCYLFKNRENKSESTENKSLKTTELCPFTVSYYNLFIQLFVLHK